jgi:hypothetical protein
LNTVPYLLLVLDINISIEEKRLLCVYVHNKPPL